MSAPTCVDGNGPICVKLYANMALQCYGLDISLVTDKNMYSVFESSCENGPDFTSVVLCAFRRLVQRVCEVPLSVYFGAGSTNTILSVFGISHQRPKF